MPSAHCGGIYGRASSTATSSAGKFVMRFWSNQVRDAILEQ
jgi:hypothetical protein